MLLFISFIFDMCQCNSECLFFYFFLFFLFISYLFFLFILSFFLFIFYLFSIYFWIPYRIDVARRKNGGLSSRVESHSQNPSLPSKHELLESKKIGFFLQYYTTITSFIARLMILKFGSINKIKSLLLLAGFVIWHEIALFVGGFWHYYVQLMIH